MHPTMLLELARAQSNESIAAARRHQLAQSAKPRPEPAPARPPLPFGFRRFGRRRRLRVVRA